MAHGEEADSLKPTALKQDRQYVDHDSFRQGHPGPRYGVFIRNDTGQTMKARIFVGADSDRARREMRKWSGFYVLTVAEGQTIEIPVEWKESLQSVSNGRIVAGHMPRIRFVPNPASGEPDPPPVELHPALDDRRAAPARRRRRAAE